MQLVGHGRRGCQDETNECGQELPRCTRQIRRWDENASAAADRFLAVITAGLCIPGSNPTSRHKNLDGGGRRNKHKLYTVGTERAFSAGARTAVPSSILASLVLRLNMSSFLFIHRLFFIARFLVRPHFLRWGGSNTDTDSIF